MEHPFAHNEMIQKHFPQLRLSLYYYLLIISPTADVQEKIMEVKKNFATQFDCPEALHSKPHITLLRFVQHEMQELKLVRMMKNIVEQFTPFQITINGFDCFPAHTIYAKIETKNVVANLVTTLKPLQAITKLDRWNKAHFITEPQITIAKKLKPWQYEKGWLQYEHTDFKTAFMVNDVLLLKRKIEDKGYTKVATFSLLNKPAQKIEQAVLF